MNITFADEIINNTTSTPSTIVTKKLLIDKNKETEITILYSDNTVDKNIIDRDILTPLMYNFNSVFPNECDKYEYLLKTALPVSNAHIETSFSTIVSSLNNGKTLILVEDERKAILVDTTNFKYRSISTPTITSTIAASKEDLNESLDLNTSIIKRRIKDKNLVIINDVVGRRSQTPIKIFYIKDIVNDNVANNITSKIHALDEDNIQSIGGLQQAIEEFPSSIVPQNFITDSVESTVSKIFEGKVVVLMEGSPYSLSTPAILVEFFHNLDDYNQRTFVASFARILRFFSATIFLILPSLYIIVTKFNPEILIDEYIQPIVNARSGIPLSPFMEIFLMQVVVELLREGGLRLPTKVGQTLSIVSGIIIGDAALKSNIISPPALFIIGISVVCTFLIPNYQMTLSLRLIGFPLLIITNFLGILGFLIGIFFLALYLLNLNVFGIEYVDFTSSDMKDTFIRDKLNKQVRRPDILKLKDKVRLNITRPMENGDSNAK